MERKDCEKTDCVMLAERKPEEADVLPLARFSPQFDRTGYRVDQFDRPHTETVRWLLPVVDIGEPL